MKRAASREPLASEVNAERTLNPMSVPRSVYVFLVVGLIAASQSGNLIKLGQAHPVAITAWRLLLATVLLAPLAARQYGLLRRLSRRDLILLFVAGAALAAHFFTWIAAVQMSTVANAAVFFSVNPVIIALAGYFFFGERVGPRLLLSIGLGLVGVIIIGWGDLRFRPEYLLGDLSSMVCALLFAVYFLVAKHVRPRLPSRVYVVSVYGTACVVSFVTLFALRLPVFAYSDQTWLCFLLMALVPTMLGHTSLNHAVRYISASRISVATLSEPVLAGLVAFYAWGEPVSSQTAVGYLLIFGSVVVLVLDRERKVEASKTETSSV